MNRCNLERHSSGSIGGTGKIKSLSNCNIKPQCKEIDEKSPRDRSLTQPNTTEVCNIREFYYFKCHDNINSKFLVPYVCTFGP